MAAKPIKSLELHYTTIQFLMKVISSTSSSSGVNQTSTAQFNQKLLNSRGAIQEVRAVPISLVAESCDQKCAKIAESLETRSATGEINKKQINHFI